MKNAGLFKAMLAAGVILTLGFASSAVAQRGDEMKTGQGGGGHPCAGDAQSICSEFIPNRAKVASCLFKNKTKLSSACRTELSGGKAKVGKSRKGKRLGKRSRRR